jgi:hypothetical protein
VCSRLRRGHRDAAPHDVRIEYLVGTWAPPTPAELDRLTSLLPPPPEDTAASGARDDPCRHCGRSQSWSARPIAATLGISVVACPRLPWTARARDRTVTAALPDAPTSPTIATRTDPRRLLIAMLRDHSRDEVTRSRVLRRAYAEAAAAVEERRAPVAPPPPLDGRAALLELRRKTAEWRPAAAARTTPRPADVAAWARADGAGATSFGAAPHSGDWRHTLGVLARR